MALTPERFQELQALASQPVSREKVYEAASQRLNVPQRWLSNAIGIESFGGDPTAANPYSSAKGIIQFIDNTAQGLGYESSQDLIEKNPTFESQMMNAVVPYIEQYKDDIKTEDDFYLSIFYPAAVKNPDLRDKPLPENVRRANPGIVTPNDYVKKVKGRSSYSPPAEITHERFAQLKALALGEAPEPTEQPEAPRPTTEPSLTEKYAQTQPAVSETTDTRAPVTQAGLVQFGEEKEKEEERGIAETLGKAWGRSVAGLESNIGGALKMFTPRPVYYDPKTREFSREKTPGAKQVVGGRIQRQFGEMLTKDAKEVMKAYQVDDPTIVDHIAEGVSSGLQFLVPATGIARGSAVIGFLGNSANAAKIATWLGIGANAVMESAVEAGGVYNTLQEKGVKDEQASKRALAAFGANLAVITASNAMGGMFTRKAATTTARKVSQNAAKKIAQGIKDRAPGTIRAMIGEGVQEAVQEGIGAVASGENLTKERALMAGGVGALTAGLVDPMVSVSQQVGAQDVAQGPTVEPESGIPVGRTLEQAIAEGDVTSKYTEDITRQQEKAIRRQEPFRGRETSRDARRAEVEAGMYEPSDAAIQVRERYGPERPTKNQVVKDFGVSREDAKELINQAYDSGYQPGAEEAVVEQPARPTVEPAEPEAAPNVESGPVAGEEYVSPFVEPKPTEAQKTVDEAVKKQQVEPVKVKKAAKPKKKPKPSPVESAVETTPTLNKVIDEQLKKAQAGAVSMKGKTIAEDIDLPKAPSKKIAQRLEKASKGIRPSFMSKIKDYIARIKRSATRKYPDLDPVKDAEVVEISRQYEDSKPKNELTTMTALRGITAGLSKNEYDVFRNTLALSDLVRTIESDPQVYEGQELQFGYENVEQLKKHLSEYKKSANASPKVKEALESRSKFVKSMTKAAVDRKILPKEALENTDTYFHRQVLKYMEDKGRFGGVGSPIRPKKAGFQKKRVRGSVEDFSTNYLESEAEWTSQLMQKLSDLDYVEQIDKAVGVGKDVENNYVKALEEKYKELGGDLDKIQEHMKITKTPKPAYKYILRNAIGSIDEVALSKSHLTNHDAFIPEGYTEMPVSQARLYNALTIPEKIVDQLQNGEIDFDSGLMKQVVAFAGQGKTIIVPENVASTMKNLVKADPTDPFSKTARAAVNTWKQLKLFAPTRFPIYFVNNFTGDGDAAYGSYPGLFKYTQQAVSDSWNFSIKKRPPSKEIIDLVGKGVLNSGFFAQEVPDISRSDYFKLMQGKGGKNPAKAYYNGVMALNTARENVLRLAAYRYALDKLKSGKKIYGASRSEVIKQLEKAKTLTVEDRAAKISRELLGDYGALSEMGNYMRKHVAPFWSWVEVNTPRYYKLFINSGKEAFEQGMPKGAGIAKKAGVAAIGTAKFGKRAATLSAFYTVAYLWNKTMFPEEHEKMKEDARQQRIILHKDKEGNLYTLRAQGALSDVLSWGGLESPEKVIQVINGDKSAVDFMKELPKDAANKAIGLVMPQFKILGELAAKKSFYPDVFKPMPIRNRWEYFWKQLEADAPYRWIANIPKRGVEDEIMRTLIYKQSIGERDYYLSYRLADKFLDMKGEKQYIGGSFTPRSTALYYFKKAIKYDDKKAAQKWWKEYIDEGGTREGLKRSISASKPGSNIPKKYRSEFSRWIQADKTRMDIMKSADSWYNSIYGAAR